MKVSLVPGADELSEGCFFFAVECECQASYRLVSSVYQDRCGGDFQKGFLMLQLLTVAGDLKIMLQR